jgi:RNA polymerase sigma factor FliA
MADTRPSSPHAHGLWDDYVRSRDPQCRSALIELYMPLARIIAARAYGGRQDQSVGFDDYLQYARVGLIEAVDRFDANRGVPFEAFSTHRIRGAIVNGLAHESESAAQRSFWRTRMAERMQSLVGAQGADPRRASLQDLVDLTIGVALGMVLDGHDVEPVDETIGGNPYAATELEQFSLRMRTAVQELPVREREVIEGHYYLRLEFQEIARNRGVTKGRVSQLHAKALARLRQVLVEEPRLNRRL